MSEVPESVQRRRELFEKVRSEIARLKPDETRVSIGMNEEEMLAALREIEQILEYAEVVRMADEELRLQR